MSSSLFEKEIELNVDESGLTSFFEKKFLGDDSMGSSLSSDSVEIIVDLGSIKSEVESESSSVVKVELYIVDGR